MFLRRATAAGIVLLVTGAVAVALPGRAGATTAVTGPQVTHEDNPYLGVKGYINPEWLDRVGQVAGGSKISNNPTSIWVDRVALAIGSPDSRRGLRNHLDAALAQAAGYVQVVLNNLPGKDCDRDWYGTGDFKFNEVDLYKSVFIDQVTAIESDPKYQSLRIINIVEPHWVQNLVLNTGDREGATSACDTVAVAGSYVGGVRYALTELHRAGQNVYTYLDAGVYYELGWEDNAESALRLIVDAVKGTPDGFAGVDGFATNIAGGHCRGFRCGDGPARYRVHGGFCRCRCRWAEGETVKAGAQAALERLEAHLTAAGTGNFAPHPLHQRQRHPRRPSRRRHHPQIPQDPGVLVICAYMPGRAWSYGCSEGAGQSAFLG